MDTTAENRTFTVELGIVLSGTDPDRLIAELTELTSSTTGRALLPEVWALSTLSDDSAGLHKDNYAHSIRVVSQTGPDSGLQTRLAALFHDIGKVPTRRINDGTVTFHNHELVGARLTLKRLAALGYRDELAERVVGIIDGASRIQSYLDNWTDSAVRRVLSDIGSQVGCAITLARADVTSRHPHVHARVQATVDSFETHAAAVVRRDHRRAERPVLNGEDLAALGVERGPNMGTIMRWLLEQNREGNLTNPEHARTAVLAHPAGPGANQHSYL